MTQDNVKPFPPSVRRLLDAQTEILEEPPDRAEFLHAMLFANEIAE